jgi:hypothetical protein
MEQVILYLSPFLAVGGWFIVTTMLRNMAGMSKRLEVEPGPEIRSSGWGSAKINGIGCKNCVKIQEHESGYVVRMMWISGGGKLWLPKPLTRVGELKASNLLFPRSRILISETNQVILYGRLADFIRESNGE